MASPSYPTEVWMAIIANLASPISDTGIIVATADTCRKRAALYNLCLTSHRFLAIARPHLYKKIILWPQLWDLRHEGALIDPRIAASLPLLLRTLLTDPSLALQVKSLVVPSTPHPDRRLRGSNDPSTPRNFCTNLATAWAKQVETGIVEQLPQHHRDMLDRAMLAVNKREAGWSTKTIDQLFMVPRQVAVLLVLCNGIETLQWPMLFDRHGVGLEYQHLKREVLPQLVKKTGPLLPRLITLKGDLSERSAVQDERFSVLSRGPGEFTFYDIHAQFKQLRRIEISGGAFLRDTQPTEYWQDVSHVEEVTLLDTHLTQQPLSAGVFAHLPRLKSFSLSLRAPTESEEERGATIGEQDFNQAFPIRASTLERLFLDTRAYESELAARYFLGPLGRLTCLPQMHALTHLSIEPYLLLDWETPNTWHHFYDSFPPNLVSLALRFAPEQGQDTLRIWARSGVGALLRASPETWKAKMPRLKKIRLEPLVFGKKIAMTLHQELAEAGIELSWEEEVVIQTHGDGVDGLTKEIEKMTV